MRPRDLIAPLALAGLRLARLGSRQAKGAFRTLLLHDVAPEQDAGFAALMSRIGKRHGFVTPEEAARRLTGEAPDDGRCPVLVSFDDGFASNYRVTLSVLDPMGIKAMFFVCPGLIDLPLARRPAAIAANVFRGLRPAEGVPGLMDWEHLEELAAKGHAIGCHSASHARLAGLEPVRLEAEVMGAADRLEHRLGRPAGWFAFPFGDLASIDAPALALIGQRFQWCRSGIRGLDSAGAHRLGLHAENVELEAPTAYQDLALDGGLDRRHRAASTGLAELAATA